MLELNDVALETVAGGHGSTKVNVATNYIKISANDNIVAKGGTMVFSIDQFNGTQLNF